MHCGDIADEAKIGVAKQKVRVGEWYYRVQKDFGMECETEVMHENSDEKRLGVRNGYGT